MLLTVLFVIFGVVTLGRPTSIFADCYSWSGWMCADDKTLVFFPSGNTQSCPEYCCDNDNPNCNPAIQCCMTTGSCCSSPGSCFLPGTKIATPGGEEAIEKIKPGDKIQSFDQETREITSGVVSEPYSVTRDHYYVVRTKSGEEVKTTDEHPFYVGKETQPAKSLKAKIINFYSMVIIYFKEGLQTVKTSFR